MDKIRIIDEPLSEEMLRAELEAVLGGWTCGTYDTTNTPNSCTSWDDKGTCGTGSGGNYCGEYFFRSVNP